MIKLNLFLLPFKYIMLKNIKKKSSDSKSELDFKNIKTHHMNYANILYSSLLYLNTSYVKDHHLFWRKKCQVHTNLNTSYVKDHLFFCSFSNSFK